MAWFHVVDKTTEVKRCVAKEGNCIYRAHGESVESALRAYESLRYDEMIPPSKMYRSHKIHPQLNNAETEKFLDDSKDVVFARSVEGDNITVGYTLNHMFKVARSDGYREVPTKRRIRAYSIMSKLSDGEITPWEAAKCWVNINRKPSASSIRARDELKDVNMRLKFAEDTSNALDKVESLINKYDEEHKKPRSPYFKVMEKEILPTLEKYSFPYVEKQYYGNLNLGEDSSYKNLYEIQCELRNIRMNGEVRDSDLIMDESLYRHLYPMRAAKDDLIALREKKTKLREKIYFEGIKDRNSVPPMPDFFLQK